MAAAGENKASNLSAALRADLFAPAAAGPVSFYEEDFSEEDVWGRPEDAATEAEDVYDREPPQGSRSAGPLGEESTASTGRVISRSGWDAAPAPLSSLTKGRGGLSALAAEGFPRSGQGPGQGPGGAAGDILSAVTVPPLTSELAGSMSGPSSGSSGASTASVFIPRPSARHDSSHHGLNSRLTRRASAPVNVPDWSKITGTLASQGGRESLSSEDEEDDDERGGAIVLPPHELVAREYAKTVSFSVREGVGRTLRGRDLDHVRTAVLRKTGFLDS